ncbi:MAG: SelL-related redox protein [Planctomycetota bacterium]
MQPKSAAPSWMARVLLLAAAFDVLGGVLVVLAPAAPLAWAGRQPPVYPEVWQCLGLIIGVYGLGYALTARHPFRLWPMVLVGLLGKVLVTFGFVWAASRGRLPWELGLLVLALGPIWWVPFGLILRGASRAHRSEQTPPVLPLDMALSLYQDPEGTDLLEASRRQPQFLVFLRHFGCTFCREALADLAAINERLRAAGTRLVLVHMSTENEARDLFNKYGLQEVTGISDPDRVLYRAFALRRGSPTQLLGWSVWKRGWEAGVRQGHGIGWLRGDAAQMPGAFVVSRGHVVAQFIHETAADRPDYVVVAEQGADQAEFQESLEAEGVGLGFQDRLRQALSSEATGRA